MKLPRDDEAFLEGLGLSWRLVEDVDDAGFLIIDGLDVSGGGFAPAQTTLMIRIPPLYNTASLDMWYCAPALTLNGRVPEAAQVQEDHADRRWQRFSRHLPDGAWVAGKDGVRSFFTFIARELQGKD